MMKILFKIILFFLILCLPFLGKCTSIDSINKEHIEVSMRMIGHEILLHANDSTSRILPIEKEGDKYRIRFESEFELNPITLNKVIDSIVKKTNIATHYIVEIEDCKTSLISYSYEIDSEKNSNIIPCQGRNQPESCYSILFTIIDSEQNNTSLYVIFISLLGIGFLLFFYIKKRKKTNDSKLISIGNYLFDTRNMKLILQEKHIELTSKESDLLKVLYENANATVNRDVILNVVWEDEGDYVGRTLDVYISKLRKKLESDSRIKILNIRGVGYKLVLDID